MADIPELAKLKIREGVLAILKEHANDPDAASIEICKLMDWKLDLSGNGWWDNDPIMVGALDLEEEEEGD